MDLERIGPRLRRSFAPAKKLGCDQVRPDDELLDVIDRRRRAVRDLPGWRSGSDRLLMLLQCATRLRALEIDQGFDTDVPWESVLAQIITWHHEIPLRQGGCDGRDAVSICLAALEAARLDNLFGTIKAGGYEVRRRGDSFRVRHRWNPAVEAADAFLEHSTAPAGLPELTPVERAWVMSRSRASRELPSADVLRLAAKRARAAIDVHRQALPEGNLPDSFPLDGGLTVGCAADVLSVLMGFASLCESAARMLKRTETTLACIRRARLLELITEPFSS